jgi:hypothetical protein
MQQWMHERMENLGRIARSARAWVRTLHHRPTVAAACISGTALALVAAAGVVLWSCESAPRRTGVGRGIVAEVPREPEVRVRIRNNIETARIDAPMQILVVSGDAGVGNFLPPPLTLTATSAGLQVTDKSAAVHTLSWPVSIQTAEPQRSSLGPPIRIDDRGADGQWKRGHTYAGTLRVDLKGPGADLAAAPTRPILGNPAPSPSPPPSAPAKMEIIETLPLERYLAGVLPAELPAGGPQAFHASAFHVQAVCARSYALHQRARAQRMGRHFEL